LDFSDDAGKEGASSRTTGDVSLEVGQPGIPSRATSRIASEIGMCAMLLALSIQPALFSHRISSS
jgi:hypothetical protein